MASARPNLEMSLDAIIASKTTETKKERKPAAAKADDGKDERGPKPEKKSGGPVKGGKAKERAEEDAPVGRKARPARADVARGGRGGGRGGGRSGRDEDSDEGAWRHDKFRGEGRGAPVPQYAAGGYYPYSMPPPAAAAPPMSRPPISLGSRVMVTNLDVEITAEDLREIFGQVCR
jgi:hypothetical protein